MNASQNNLRILVDECASPTLVERFRQTLTSGTPLEWVRLSEQHRGIPDAVILQQLLNRDTVLLTGDCVLHNQACQLGFRSYTLDEKGNLRRGKLPEIPAGPPLAIRGGELKSDYNHPSNPIATALKSGLSERDFKRYRTRRRRIRSHFGSASSVTSVAVTIGSRRSRGGLICGYGLALAGCSGASGLRACEGYGLVSQPPLDPAYPLLHALRELYLLQLENVPTEIYVIPPESLRVAREQLSPTPSSATSSAPGALALLLTGLQKVQLLPCVKGRFFDAMENKLKQVERDSSNELVPFAVQQLISALQTIGSPDQATSSDDDMRASENNIVI